MASKMSGERGGGSPPTATKALLIRPLIATVIVILVVGVSLLTSERQETPVTHREQHVEMTDAEQMQAGEQEYENVLEKHADDVVSRGPKYEEVQRVADRITVVAAEDKPAFEWEFSLIRSKQVNAYCLPGGKIVVYTGILPVTENDAGLATVLGHETAHATAEHSAERLYRENLTHRLISILAGGLAFTPLDYVKVVALMGAGSEVGMILPWSREQESEADHIGLIYMARAGYDPDQAVAFWQRMANASDGEEKPEYVSTHPSDEHRIENIRGWMPEARREYVPYTGTDA
jgi:predicted Zn-dependent protease